MSLMSASIKSAEQLRNCLRISVMSRHTLNDGLTPNPQITNSLFDIHLPEFGPPPKLIGKYYRQEIAWVEFAELYQEYVKSDMLKVLLDDIIVLSKEMDVVLLCIEDVPDFCHRRLLVERCLQLDSSIIVNIS